MKHHKAITLNSQKEAIPILTLKPQGNLHFPDMEIFPILSSYRGINNESHTHTQKDIEVFVRLANHFSVESIIVVNGLN